MIVEDNVVFSIDVLFLSAEVVMVLRLSAVVEADGDELIVLV